MFGDFKFPISKFQPGPKKAVGLGVHPRCAEPNLTFQILGLKSVSLRGASFSSREMANEELGSWTDLLHSSTKLLEQAAPSAQFPPLQVSFSSQLTHFTLLYNFIFVFYLSISYQCRLIYLFLLIFLQNNYRLPHASFSINQFFTVLF